ncbi:MAG TPA: NUDIX domain-containing protein [Candidatus Saccharimonadales bacterium]|nr:NUDIX domain-containing protein [Candidatus Saccharimonadales bacterium]
MAKQSAGLVIYRQVGQDYEVLLVHPGGPFWAKKDDGSWSIPKGEFDDSEEPLAAAKREFKEETNITAPEGNYQELGEAKQSSGKIVHAFALEANVDLETFKSNMFEMEWPPRSGKKQEFPENDKAAWTTLTVAGQKLVKGQLPLLQKLAALLKVPPLQPRPETGSQQSLL